jgi:hypothetical protein
VWAHPFYGASKKAELSLRYTTIGRNKDESITDRGILRYLKNGGFRREEKHLRKQRKMHAVRFWANQGEKCLTEAMKIEEPESFYGAHCRHR